MEKDLREAAQLEQRDEAPDATLGTPRLLVGHVVGEPNAHGWTVRALRFATADDVRDLAP